MTITEIRKAYRKDREELRDRISETKEYEAKEIRDALKTIGLGGDVIRLSDNKKGILQVNIEKGTYLGTSINFYPYTKKGQVSLLSSGYIPLDDEASLLKRFKGVGK